MALAVPRRLLSLLPILLLLSFAFFFLSGSGNDGWTSTIPRGAKNLQKAFTTDDGLLSFGGGRPKRHVRISIMETGGTHDEVWSALTHGFGGNGNADLRLFLKGQRYNIGEIVGNFSLASPILSLNSTDDFDPITRRTDPPHILVSTTCELDLIDKHTKDAFDYLLTNATTHLMCVVHHADRWAEGKHVDVVKKWVEAERVDFVGLSPHTMAYLEEHAVPSWHTNKTVPTRVFIPVFPMQLPEFDVRTINELSLAMQGDYEAARRDYKGIFSHLSTIITKAAEFYPAHKGEGKVMLHLIGHGIGPNIPQDIANHVRFDYDLPYPKFYSLMSGAYAILPAFASDTYYDRKASSTVPAALIAGAPLVADEKLLASYSYYPRDAAWVQLDGESELDVVARVIGDKQEYIKKRRRVRQACNDLSEKNKAHAKQWVDEILRKSGQSKH